MRTTTSEMVEARAPLPVLEYDAPACFERSDTNGLERYITPDGTASLQIYQFRRYTGDIALAFRRTLLREWVDPQHRETNVVAQPMFGRDAIAGARAVLTAHFIEAVARRPKEHIRFLVVVGDAAALIDVSAVAPDILQHVAPALRDTFTSMRVATRPR